MTRPQGHNQTTLELIPEIDRLLKAGGTIQAIAQHIGLDRKTIYKIANELGMKRQRGVKKRQPKLQPQQGFCREHHCHFIQGRCLACELSRAKR